MSAPQGSKDTPPPKEDYYSDSSCSDGSSEKCPICLLGLHEQELGKPNICEHLFCCICISEWAKVVRTCPIDRLEFNQINVFKSIEEKILVRTEILDKKCVGLDEFLQDDDLTYCEICRLSDREDQMLLCDGCDLGYHMNCLENPLTEIPRGNWYCDNCFSSEDDSDVAEEVDFLNDDIEENGGLTLTRLRFSRSSPISRTRQSQRIVSAIRRIRDSNSEEEEATEPPEPTPSTSTSRGTNRTQTTTRRKKRKRTRRRRYRTVITEYDVDSDDKFAMKTRKIRRKIRRRRRKQAKSRPGRRSRDNDKNLSCLKNSNAFDLQYRRAAAGITNFNIFEPSNQLDFVSDDANDDSDMYSEMSGRGEVGVMSRARAVSAIHNGNLKKNLVNKRVLQNIPTTSSVNLLDTILQQQEMWLAKDAFKKNFTVEKDGKVKCVASSKEAAPSDGGDYNNKNGEGGSTSRWTQNTSQQQSSQSSSIKLNRSFGGASTSSSFIDFSRQSMNEPVFPQQGHFISSFAPAPKKKDEKDKNEEKDKEVCPNYSIYSADAIDFAKDPDSNSKGTPQMPEEQEMYDLVQESDDDGKNDAYNPESPTDEAYDPGSPTNLEDFEDSQRPDNPESPENFDSPILDKIDSPGSFKIAKSPEALENIEYSGPELPERENSVLEAPASLKCLESLLGISGTPEPKILEQKKIVKGFKKPLLDFDMFEDSNDRKSEQLSNQEQPEIIQEEPRLDQEQPEEAKSDQKNEGENLEGIEEPPEAPQLQTAEVGNYTPPIEEKVAEGSPVTPVTPVMDEPLEKSRKERKRERYEKREIERYDVRKRIGNRDEFGRNRSRSRSLSKGKKKPRSHSKSSRSRSRSTSKKRFVRKRSRSFTPPMRKKKQRRERSISMGKKMRDRKIRSPSRSRSRSKSRSVSRNRRHRVNRSLSRSFSISPSPPIRSPSRSRSGSRVRHVRHKIGRKERRTPSPPAKYRNRSKSKKKSKSHERKMRKHKQRRSRTRTPPLPVSKSFQIKTPSPPRKFSDNQKVPRKSKKKKSENKSKSLRSAIAVPTTLTKEVFTSGQNILVSVNFNNNGKNGGPPSPTNKRSASKEKEKLKNLEEPKEIVDITMKKKLDSVKPVAIIDLDRSPFKELTPDYNVIELSDSENEKQIKSPDPPKSPAAKMYDPFDISNSPAENVTSSIENFGDDVTTTAAQAAKAKEVEEKLTDQSMINVYNTTTTSIPCISASSGDENVDMIVTSSSANSNQKQIQPPEESVQMSQVSPYMEMDAGLDSPYSPGSDDYDDLFANSFSVESPKKSKGGKIGKSSGPKLSGADKFDVLFGSTSPVAAPAKKRRKREYYFFLFLFFQYLIFF